MTNSPPSCRSSIFAPYRGTTCPGESPPVGTGNMMWLPTSSKSRSPSATRSRVMKYGTVDPRPSQPFAADVVE